MTRELLVGVTGAVSASMIETHLFLLSQIFNLNIILTESSKEFVTKLTLSAYGEVYDNVFTENGAPHIILSEKSDGYIILPATAHTISKISHGRGDDLLSLTALAFEKNILFFPSMNPKMWSNLILQDNVSYLKSKGHKFFMTSKKTYEVTTKKLIDSDVVLPSPKEVINDVLQNI